MVGDVFAGLNPEQAAAVAAVRGPVCILAGAGCGKTTTIARRIAHQVASGAVAAPRVLAVTFTDKAAREMGSRLAALDVRGVRVKTFHAEALAQHAALTGGSCEILPSKAPLLAGLVQRLPAPYKFISARDIATEIEWARNRRIPPQAYQEAVADRSPPIPADLMAGVFGSYEQRKRERGLLDFEDLLERTLELLEAGGPAAQAVRERYQAFSVDEYQDVNLLQQSLLEAWLGDRREVCVVGDDYQSIFGFTGANPEYLLGFAQRYPGCHVVKLTTNYRSTPAVLEVANRVAGSFGEAPRLLAPCPGLYDGADRDGAGLAPIAVPSVSHFATGAEEVRFIVATAQRLQRGGVTWEEMAVLFRINGRSESLEQELARAGIPYQVAGAAFLRRPAAKSVLAALRRVQPGEAVLAAVEAAVRRLGYRPGDEELATGDEATRQADLGRLLELAREYPGDGSLAGFLDDLQRRFGSDGDGRGIQVLTYHRAKGKEFEAVFLPRLEDKELPFSLARSPEDQAEERRLFYVGITRAKRHLFISWAASRDDGPRRRGSASGFLQEIRPAQTTGSGAGSDLPGRHAGPVQRDGARRPGPRAGPSGAAAPDSPLLAALKDWRRREAREREVPAYVIFNDRTLTEIAETRPSTVPQLLSVPGVGPAKIASHAEAVLALVKIHAGG